MLLLLAATAHAGSYTHSDWSTATVSGNLTGTASPGDLRLVSSTDLVAGWYDAGVGTYIQLQKDDGTYFSAAECPADFLPDETTENGTPFRTGPYSVDGYVAGIPSGVALPLPLADTLVEQAHLLHPGGRCADQTHTVTFDYADGSSRSVSYTNPWDCSPASSSGAGYTLTSLTAYGVAGCCDSWYEAAIDNPEPSLVVDTLTVSYADGCGGVYPGQIWAVSLELESTSYADFQAASPSISVGIYTSDVVDTGATARWLSAAYSSTLDGSDTVTVRVRVGNTATPDSTWSSWTTISSAGTTLSLSNARYAQYTTTIYGGSTNTRLHDVTLNYSHDLDGDGVDPVLLGGLDCDDTDITIYGGATELEDGLDNDCDGQIDNNTAAFDDDGDGYSEDAGDCDDTAAAALPGGVEVVDGLDNDCDGISDNGTSAGDDDGDGVSEDDGDCDDADPTRAAGLPELIDNLDNDCDSLIDEGTTAYDDDADGRTEDAGDCDDSDPSVSPDQIEQLNGRDDDCDGEIDENTSGTDDDRDGLTEDEGDCDDADPYVYPGQIETCNTKDDDCNGIVDTDALEVPSWYADSDGDGYGDDAVVIIDCTAPADSVSVGGDCDDTDSAYNPGALEEDCADPTDYNCDGSAGFVDEDGDGSAACADCDDQNPDAAPGLLEYCNSFDDDCDGEIDEEGAEDGDAYYADLDGDGHGDSAPIRYICYDPSGIWCGAPPSGYSCGYGDCDGTDPNIHYYADEICDGLNNDCDYVYIGPPGEENIYDWDHYAEGIDNDPDIAPSWYLDEDLDGYGAGDAVLACDAPEDRVEPDGDCDDTDTDYNPAAAESDCTDPNDYNCDGLVAYADADFDGTPACVDCDDLDAWRSPTMVEFCDGKDNNCNELIDDNADDAARYYYDADGDGYGDLTITEERCEASDGWVLNSGDCDDSNSTIAPSADEVPDDGVDQDCSGADLVLTESGNPSGDDSGTPDDSGEVDSSPLDSDAGGVIPRDTGKATADGCGCGDGGKGAGAWLLGLGVLLGGLRRRTR